MGFAEIIHGGMNGKALCIPTNMRDYFIMVIYPPLYVFLSEIYTENHVFDPTNIIISFILTCLFYFPGVVHAMSVARERGPIKAFSIKVTEVEK